MKCATINVLLLGLLLVGVSDSRGQDKYEEYARWWKQRQEKKPLARNKDGTRKGYFGVQFHPKSISAAEAEKSGLVEGPTFVLGVSIGKQSRAFPLHAIGELQNDTLSEVAIAASW
ncbi:MAG: hypothetical protein IID44_15800 [Planctomycetes bacterium]|nr:hypothetical protein [Planctomycetota bacterium]